MVTGLPHRVRLARVPADVVLAGRWLALPVGCRPHSWYDLGMPREDTLLYRILQGRSDANVRFDDLRKLLTDLGFQERVRGGHHVFVRPGVEQLINLQRKEERLSLTKSGRFVP